MAGEASAGRAGESSIGAAGESRAGSGESRAGSGQSTIEAAGGTNATAISDQVAETWLSTLEINAAFDRPWVDAAVAWLLAGGRRGPVVDAGSGAGGATAAFAQRSGDAGPTVVVAVDRDPRLMAVARRRAEAEGVADRVAWVCGRLDGLGVRPGSAGLVWASGVVHHIADQQRAVDDLTALLVPGGTLALVEGGLPLRCLPHELGVGRPGLEARMDEARARWFADLRAELGGPPLPYGWPEALARAGLGQVRVRSFIAEATPPLDAVGRAMVHMHLDSALAELGERLDPGDRTTLARLLDPDDPAWIGGRDDLVITAVRTVHAATRPGG